jgi:branched-chain amino acid transport system permease protein
MYYLCLGFLILAIAMVIGLRRSRSGRVLIALRENETELQSFGINVVRTKLAAFALAGFLAGVAGVFHAHHQRAISAQAFGAQESIDVFVYAVIGGISSTSGALLGAGFQALERVLPQGDPLIAFFFNKDFALLFLLFVIPGGLTALFYGLRDQILRIVALRRQMVVPALFEDFDPETLERRLIPLAEAIEGTGLRALPYNQRYRLQSELYDIARSTADGTRSRLDDTKALGAAARAVESE